jgi:hypothetical protein
MSDTCIQIKRSGKLKGMPCGKKVKDFENQLCFEHSKRLKNNLARVSKPKKENVKKEKPKKEVENWGQEGVDWVYEEDIEQKTEEKIEEENTQQQESIPPQTEEVKLESLDFENKIQINDILEQSPPQQEIKEEKPKRKRKEVIKEEPTKPVRKPFSTNDLIKTGFYLLATTTENLSVEHGFHIEGVTNKLMSNKDIEICLEELAHEYSVESIEVSPEVKLIFLCSTVVYSTYLENRLLLKNKSLNFSAIPNNGPESI